MKIIKKKNKKIRTNDVKWKMKVCESLIVENISGEIGVFYYHFDFSIFVTL